MLSSSLRLASGVSSDWMMAFAGSATSFVRELVLVVPSTLGQSFLWWLVKRSQTSHQCHLRLFLITYLPGFCGFVWSQVRNDRRSGKSFPSPNCTSHEYLLGLLLPDFLVLEILLLLLLNLAVRALMTRSFSSRRESRSSSRFLFLEEWLWGCCHFGHLCLVLSAVYSARA